MIQLKELSTDGSIILKCKLSYVATSIPLNENYQEQHKNHHFSEAALAYLSHKKNAIENYKEAEKAITPFLQKDVNNYDKRLIENRIRDYILFSKISLDLLVCLVKILIDGNLPENESEYPDIYRRKINNKSIINQLTKFLIDLLGMIGLKNLR